MFLKKTLLGIATAGALLATAASHAVDPKLEPYQRASGISGNLTSIGSDTLNNLMTLWAEDFQGVYPNLNIQIQGAGSSTAPPVP
jgi:phosphate transport system substrate-binding protein